MIKQVNDKITKEINEMNNNTDSKAILQLT